MSSEQALHGLNCPNCGGMVPIPEGQRIVRVDPRTGERSYLEDAQYATEKAAAQRSVEANCK